jgi:hypothetical protein
MMAGLVLAFTTFVIAPKAPRGIGLLADFKHTTEREWSGVGRVSLVNEDGLVLVRPATGNVVRMVAKIKVWAEDSASLALAENHMASLIAATNQDGLLRIVAEPEERPDPVNIRVDFTLYVPEGTDVEIGVASGNLIIGKGCGDVVVRGSNTDIHVSAPAGSVAASTLNGRIVVEEVARNCHLDTVNGSIWAYMQGGELRAETTNGSIHAWLSGPAIEGCDLTSRNGGITLGLRKVGSVQISARTRRGRIRTGFPVDTSAGIKGRRRLEGTIGEGGVPLKLTTLNGNIAIDGSDQ